MSHESLCPGCFITKGDQRICPRCAFDEGKSRAALLLPLRSCLHQGRYMIGRVLGRPGGFGITYLAYEIDLKTRVAVKEYLPRDLAGRESNQQTVSAHSREDAEMFRYGLDQFFQEAKTLEKFDHDHIVRVRNFFEENGTGYLVMDYYEGVSLAEYLNNRPGGYIGEKIAAAMMMPILDGLREIHGKGVLHRDIKPTNIYLTKGNRPILLDFGAARQAVGERSKSWSVMLSEGYAPPEQYYRQGDQGPWTDVYGSAAVLYRAVTGQTPPPSIERLKKDELPAPEEFGVSTNFAMILRQGMAVESQARIQTIGELQRMLAGVVAAVGEPEPGGQSGINTRQRKEHVMDHNAGISGFVSEVEEVRITIGRSKSNDIVLADETVSRTHAQIVLLADGTMRLVDQGSSRGTFVKRPGGKTQRICESTINHADTVFFGDLAIPASELAKVVQERLRKEIIPPKPEVIQDSTPVKPEVPSVERKSKLHRGWIVAGIVLFVFGLRWAMVVARHSTHGASSSASVSSLTQQTDTERADQLKREEDERQQKAREAQLQQTIEDGAKMIVSRGAFIMAAAHPTAKYLDAEYLGYEQVGDGRLWMTFELRYLDTLITSTTYWLRIKVLMNGQGEMEKAEFLRDTGYIRPGAVTQAVAEAIRSALEQQ